jgi:hypothetical protein
MAQRNPSKRSLPERKEVYNLQKEILLAFAKALASLAHLFLADIASVRTTLVVYVFLRILYRRLQSFPAQSAMKKRLLSVVRLLPSGLIFPMGGRVKEYVDKQGRPKEGWIIIGIAKVDRNLGVGWK